MVKEFWECNVCGDIHFGKTGPGICPTCKSKDAYEGIDKEDAKKKMDL